MAKAPKVSKPADNAPDPLEKFDAADPRIGEWYTRWRDHLPSEAQSEIERLL